MLLILAIAGCLLARQSSAGAAAEVAPEVVAPEVIAEVRRIAAIAPTEHAPPPRTVDVLRYALHVAVDPERRAIEGRAEIELSTFGAPRRAITLDADELSIQAVADAAGQPLAFKHEGTTLEIDLGQELAPDAPTRLVVTYSATPRRGLQFVIGDDGKCSQVWSQGQCSMASAWFPCRDYPDDRASSELFVTLPDEWKSVSNGVLIESAPASSAAPAESRRRVDHWRMDFPHPAYLTSMALGPFVEIDLGRVRDVPLLAYATADLHGDALLTLQPTGAMLEKLERFTGLPYPYPAYRQVCVADFPWEGMENIGATTLAQEALASPDRYDDVREAAEGLVMHELAHQWFGDLVSPASWADLWLNEGFARFAEAWWLEQRGDAGGAHAALAEWASMQQNAVDHRSSEPRPIVSASYVVPDELFDATVYDRAGAFLHLLRHVAGPEKFDAGVKAWIAEHQGKSVGTAEFEATFAKATGLPLSNLFHEWLHSSGQPAIDFSWRFDAGSRRLELSAHQKQTGDNVPEVFHVPVDVAWQVGDQRRTTRMELDARRCRVAIECDERPKFVRFNAGGALFGELSVEQPLEAWRAQLALDSDPLGRVEAARELAEGWDAIKPPKELEGSAVLEGLGGTPEQEPDKNAQTRRLTLAALSRALIADPVIAVREAGAAAFGAIRGDVARAALAGALWDEEPSVRAAAATALSQFADDDEALGMLVRRFESEHSQAVSIATLHAVSRVAKVRAIAILLKMIDLPQSPPWQKGAALLSLVELAEPESGTSFTAEQVAAAVTRAVKLSEAPTPRALRLQAIEALGPLAVRDEAAGDALLRRLDDPSVAVSFAALDALDRDDLPLRFVPALVAFHAKAPFDDQRRRVRTILRKLAPRLPS